VGRKEGGGQKERWGDGKIEEEELIVDLNYPSFCPLRVLRLSARK
jgi:hypothetical protein